MFLNRRLLLMMVRLQPRRRVVRQVERGDVLAVPPKIQIMATVISVMPVMVSTKSK
jgi:hypothetical protein